MYVHVDATQQREIVAAVRWCRPLGAMEALLAADYGDGDEEEEEQLCKEDTLQQVKRRRCDTLAKADSTCKEEDCSVAIAKTVGDEEDHQGRSRSFPHVDGNYATHVYIHLSFSKKSCDVIESLIDRIREELPLPLHRMFESDSKEERRRQTTETPSASQVSGNAGSMEIGWHLSLSRTVPTRRGQHKTLLSGLRKQFARTLKKDGLPVNIEFDARRPIALVNDDQSRTFLAINMSNGNFVEQLTKCVRTVDNIFVQHGLRTYYMNPIHHVSIGWLLGNKFSTLHEVLTKNLYRNADVVVAQIQNITCRIGCTNNTVYQHR